MKKRVIMFFAFRAAALFGGEYSVEEEICYKRECFAKASEHGDVAMAKRLLEDGMPINEECENSYLPLHVAVRSDCAPMIDLLLDYGAHIEAPQFRYSGLKWCRDDTALAYAIRLGKYYSVKRLLERGAEFQKKFSSGSVPIVLALICERKSIGKLLMEYGADISVVKESLRNYKILGDQEISDYLAKFAPWVKEFADTKKKNMKPFLLLHQKPDTAVSRLPMLALQMVLQYVAGYEDYTFGKMGCYNQD